MRLPGDGLGWWQLNLLLAPAGTPVTPFDPNADLKTAAAKLAAAGTILAGRPEAMQLRYLTALGNIAGERARTIVFPIPADFMKLRGS